MRNQNIDVELDGKLNINITDEFYQVSVDGKNSTLDIEYYLRTNLIYEVPERLTDKRFRASNKYWASNLLVYLNGFKEIKSDIIEINDTDFEFTDEIPIGELVEIQYLKKS